MTLAFAFPGQGSLRAGMAAAWAGHAAAEVFERVGAVAGLDLEALADDDASGARTAVAQPAIFAASLAAHRALTEVGVRPEVVAGHSLGELTAAVAAGALTLEAAAELVAERGRAMAAACATRPGTMAAVVRLDGDVVERIVAAVDGAAVANDNAPGQVVVSGTPAAVAAVMARAEDAGGRGLPLDVEGAFHSPAMASAVDRVAAVVDRLHFSDPHIQLVTGTTGQVLESGAAIGRAVVDGVLAPVRWRAVQERFAALGVAVMVEVGPGGVLKGLARRAVPDIEVVTVASPADVATAAERLGDIVASHV